MRDTGPGIPEEEIPVVLDPFGQGSNAIKSAEQGAGLGLPIVKSIIDLHGGTFRLNSKVGEGTEVIVTFPPERVIPAAEPAGEAAAKKTDAVPLPAPRKTFVAETTAPPEGTRPIPHASRPGAIAFCAGPPIFPSAWTKHDTNSPQKMRLPASKTAIRLFDHDRLFSRTVVACAG